MMVESDAHEQIDGIVLAKKLGEGGTSTVYLGIDRFG